MEKTRYRKLFYSQYLAVILALLILGGLAFLGHWAMRQATYEDQFVVPWAAGRAWLLEGTDPYAEEVVQLARTTLYRSDFLGQLPDGATLEAPFINLVFSLPLSLIPYDIARMIWVTLLGACLAFSGIILLKMSQWKTGWIEKVGVIVLVMAWLPSLQSILMGSLMPIVLLLILSGVYALLHNKDTLAGFLLALAFGSIQISFLILFLVIVWALIHRRWSILVAYFSGLGFLFVVSLIVLRTWPMSWLAVNLGIYSDFSWVHTPLMSMAALLPGISNYLSVALHLGIAIYLIVLWASSFSSKIKNFSWHFVAILNIAFLFQIENAGSALILTLPALFLTFRYWSEKWQLVGRVISWLILLAICLVPWFNVDVPSVFVGDVAFTGWTIGLPLFAIFGLSSVRWWALKTPNLPTGELNRY